MKFKIDTEKKTVTIDGDTNIGELVSVLEKLYPKEWRSFLFVMDTPQSTATITHWIGTQDYIHYPPTYTIC